MNKDNQGGFTGNPEEQSYEDYLKQQQSEMAQEMSDAGKQAPKGAGGESGLDDAPGPKKDNPIDGDFQIEDFSGEGSYDSYLAGQSGLDDKEGKGGRGGKANATDGDAGIHDKPASGGGGAASIASSLGSGIDEAASGGQSEGDTAVSALTEAAAGPNPMDGGGAADGAANASLGSKIGGAISGAGSMAINGIRNMFSRMGGAFGELANTIGVSVKVLTLATALVGGGGLTILGITVFGGPDYERYVAPADCRVQAKSGAKRS